jgi:hypothetical protein
MNPCSPQGGRRMVAPSLIVTALLSASSFLPSTASAATATASAAGAYHRADVAVIDAAKRVVRCNRTDGTADQRCVRLRGSLQAAGVKLSRLQRAVTAHTAKTARLSARQQAPKLTVSGATLKWAKVADVSSYVLVSKVAGKADRYSVVTGTSTTPAAQPGKAVTYGLRTAVVGSAWAKEVKITYPAAGASAAPATSTTTTSTTPGAGSASSGSTASGSSGATSGSTGSGTTPTPPTPAAPSTSATFQAGLVSNAAYAAELPHITALGAKTARLEFDIDTPAAELAPFMDSYAKAGVKPLLLAGFQGRSPSTADARNLASWAAAYGPGGTFWQGKGYAASTAVTNIEFGNESNQSYQYASLSSDPNWPSSAAYADIATKYALGFQQAAQAIAAANTKVGLLAIGDTPGNWRSWMDNVYKAVPHFDDLVAGWVMHPYGPSSRWQPNMDTSLEIVAAHGAPSTIPIFITEYGIATDNGRCLSDNYGGDKCMTYDAAGAALSSTVSAMRARYGSRLAAMYVYQANDQKAPATTSNREAYFGGLTMEGAAKGGYTAAVKALLAG